MEQEKLLPRRCRQPDCIHVPPGYPPQWCPDTYTCKRYLPPEEGAMNNQLPRWAVKVVSGYLEGGLYSDVVAQCSMVVGEGLYSQEEQRQKLVQAIKLNVINRKEYPITALVRLWDLGISESKFIRERNRFTSTVARAVGIIKS